MKNSKDGFISISFSWLFAIIIGAIILFFAIYAAVKLIGTEEKVTTAETGKEIEILLNPLETGFGEETTTLLTLPVESRLENNCEIFGNFGEQEMSVSQKFRGKWTKTDVSAVSYNKYIFSNKSTEGKNFYLFSKPFEFPFKVSDLIFLTSTNDIYCFIDASKDIEEEISNLNQKNLLIKNCPSNSIRVCFEEKENCNIKVNENMGTVSKGRELVYYETPALMYGAIFSEKDIYECQVSRLMKRLKEISLIYNDKESFISKKECPVEVNLLILASVASSLQDSSELINVRFAADDAEIENKQAYCRLW